MALDQPIASQNLDQASKPPKVAIVVPSMAMVHMRFAMALAGVVAESARYAVLDIINPRGGVTAANRNQGVLRALKLDADYVLFLDSDMSFPSNTLVRLLAARKDIVGANYVARGPGHRSLVIPKGNVKTTAAGVVEVDKLPTGIMLIRTEVFKKLKKPWFIYPAFEEDIGTEDYPFCDAAREAGYQIYCDIDLSLEVVHWGDMGFRWNAQGGFDQVEV